MSLKVFLANLWSGDRDLKQRHEYHYERRIKFSDHNNLQSDLKYYQADDVWFWSQTPTFRYMSYKEPSYMPEDIWRELIKKEYKRVGVWGVEIGIPYCACTRHASPVPVRSLEIFYTDLKKHKTGTGLNTSQLVDITLLGGPEEMRKGWGWLYKHWLHAEKSDSRALYQPNSIIDEEKIEAFWNSPKRKQFEKLLHQYLASDTNIPRLIKRTMKWEMIRLEKEKRYEDRAMGFGWFTVITKIMLFLKNYGKSFK